MSTISRTYDSVVLCVLVHHSHVQATVDAVRSLIEETQTAEILRIVVADNSGDEDQHNRLCDILLSDDSNSLIEIMAVENDGYFGAINSVLNHHKRSFQFLVIANNDLVFGSKFAEKIPVLFSESPFTVAYPALHDAVGDSQNPRVEHRIPRWRLFAYRLYYTKYWVSRVMAIAFAFVKSFSRWLKPSTSRAVRKSDIRREILLGVGACVILSPEYFQHFSDVPGEVFLFGEEALLADRVRQSRGRTIYLPELFVRHEGHATVSLLGNRGYWEIQRRSSVYFIPALNRINRQESKEPGVNG